MSEPSRKTDAEWAADLLLVSVRLRAAIAYWMVRHQLHPQNQSPEAKFCDVLAETNAVVSAAARAYPDVEARRLREQWDSERKAQEAAKADGFKPSFKHWFLLGFLLGVWLLGAMVWALKG